MNHASPFRIAPYLQELAVEEDRLREEAGEEGATAESIQKDRESKIRLEDTAADRVRRIFGNRAPPGYTNDPKIREIVDFVVNKKGITDDRNIQRTLSHMLIQAKSVNTMKGLTDLDRVFLTLKQGQFR